MEMMQPPMLEYSPMPRRWPGVVRVVGVGVVLGAALMAVVLLWGLHGTMLACWVDPGYSETWYGFFHYCKVVEIFGHSGHKVTTFDWSKFMLTVGVSVGIIVAASVSIRRLFRR